MIPLLSVSCFKPQISRSLVSSSMPLSSSGGSLCHAEAASSVCQRLEDQTTAWRATWRKWSLAGPHLRVVDAALRSRRTLADIAVRRSITTWLSKKKKKRSVASGNTQNRILGAGSALPRINSQRTNHNSIFPNARVKHRSAFASCGGRNKSPPQLAEVPRDSESR